jgi:hypothetical protein
MYKHDNSQTMMTDLADDIKYFCSNFLPTSSQFCSENYFKQPKETENVVGRLIG